MEVSQKPGRDAFRKKSISPPRPRLGTAGISFIELGSGPLASPSIFNEDHPGRSAEKRQKDNPCDAPRERLSLGFSSAEIVIRLAINVPQSIHARRWTRWSFTSFKSGPIHSRRRTDHGQ